MTDKNQRPWDIARPLVEKDYADGTITKEMKPADVYKMRPEYQAVPYTNFRTNLCAAKKRVDKEKEGKTAQTDANNDDTDGANDDKENNDGQPPTEDNNGLSAWEVALPLLTHDYFTGKVTSSMKNADVRAMRKEYMAVKKRNFATNFRNLKTRVDMHKGRADQDHEDLIHDLWIYRLAKDTPGEWDGSMAQKYLKEDIGERGMHRFYGPKAIYESRDEYQAFPFKKFCNHLNHEKTRRGKESNYWLVKKMKKEEAKKKKNRAYSILDEEAYETNQDVDELLIAGFANFNLG